MSFKITGIKDFEGLYQLYSDGRIYSIRKNKFLKDRISGYNGYYQASLQKDKSIKYIVVHRLVANHFIPNPKNLPQVNHINGNKLDNRVENLEWCTAQENSIHAFENGLRKYNPSDKRNEATSRKVRKFTEEQVLDIRNSFLNGEKKIDIAKRYNVVRQTIYQIIKQDYKY